MDDRPAFPGPGLVAGAHPARRASVLVTGGAGFIGARLVRRLLAKGARVTVIDDLSAGTLSRLPAHPALEVLVADVSDPARLPAALAGQPAWSAIVHLAARVGVARVLADPEGCAAAHRAGAAALVDAIAGLAPGRRPRLIAASTSEVYAPRSGRLREDDPLRPLDGVGRWAYAASKREVEERFDRARLWPAAAAPIHVRLFNVTGPGQDADAGMVLPRFLAAARAGEPLPIHGAGDQVRTFAHVDDVADDLARLALRPGIPAGPLNLGGEARATVLELAREVLAATGSTAGTRSVDPRARLGPRFDEVQRREPALDRARSFGLALRTRSLREIVADAARADARGSLAFSR